MAKLRPFEFVEEGAMDQIIEQAKYWAECQYFDESDRKKVQALINENGPELKECFYKNLEFGTGGLRGIIGQGTNRINRYNVRKAAFAFGEVICKKFNAPQVVAINYDTRLYSREFSKEVCSVLASKGIKTKIFSSPRPVGAISYAIRQYGFQGGIMITASHNPKEYNGIKVYWDHGAQVTPPEDQEIIDSYNKIINYEAIQVVDFQKAWDEGIISSLDDSLDSYFNHIKSLTFQNDLCQEFGQTLSITYTPLHGSGVDSLPKALANLGPFDVQIVKEQENPDPAFPTVKYPNPEEKEALKMAVELMKKNGTDLVMGTDPDTDRLAVALQYENETYYLNGNELGVLLLDYILKNSSITDKSYVLKTIVTSSLQEKLCQFYNVSVFNTLTGFKWMADKSRELERQGWDNLLFSSEESFGYLSSKIICDKDAVNAASLVAELALELKREGKNLVNRLEEIYLKFGIHKEYLLSFNFKGESGALKIKAIMEKFRGNSDTQICGEKVLWKKDYLTNTCWDFEKNCQEKLDLPRSNVIGIGHSGGRLYLRPSGTEPKIKFYVMLESKDNNKEFLDEKFQAWKELIERWIE